MTTLAIQVPDDIYQKLKARAKDQGRELSAVALEVLETGFRYVPCTNEPPRLSKEEWLREFHEWVESHPKVDVVLDDSRETIYEGR